MICKAAMGPDQLLGGLGADTLTGGLGDDVYFVDDSSDIVSELLNEGTNRSRPRSISPLQAMLRT